MKPTEDIWTPIGIFSVLRPSAVSVLTSMGIDLQLESGFPLAECCLVRGIDPASVLGAVAEAEGRSDLPGDEALRAEIWSALGKPWESSEPAIVRPQPRAKASATVTPEPELAAATPEPIDVPSLDAFDDADFDDERTEVEPPAEVACRAKLASGVYRVDEQPVPLARRAVPGPMDDLFGPDPFSTEAA